MLVKFLRTLPVFFNASVCYSYAKCVTLTNMENYRKRYHDWADAQREIDKKGYPTKWKVGGVFWANQGVNIGSEQDGKGDHFTRPILIITEFSERLVLIAPISSKMRRHRYRFKIMVKGEPRMVLLDQVRTIDLKRLGYFIDEIPMATLRQIRSALANLIDV